MRNNGRSLFKLIAAQKGLIDFRFGLALDQLGLLVIRQPGVLARRIEILERLGQAIVTGRIQDFGEERIHSSHSLTARCFATSSIAICCGKLMPAT